MFCSHLCSWRKDRGSLACFVRYTLRHKIHPAHPPWLKETICVPSFEAALTSTCRDRAHPVSGSSWLHDTIRVPFIEAALLSTCRNRILQHVVRGESEALFIVIEQAWVVCVTVRHLSRTCTVTSCHCYLLLCTSLSPESRVLSYAFSSFAVRQALRNTCSRAKLFPLKQALRNTYSFRRKFALRQAPWSTLVYSLAWWIIRF